MKGCRINYLFISIFIITKKTMKRENKKIRDLQVQESLRQSTETEHPLLTLLDEVEEGAIIISMDGKILYCNPGFARMLKMPREKLVGMIIENLVYFKDRPSFDGLVSDIRSANKMKKGTKITFIASEGNVSKMHLRGGSIRVDEVPCIYLICVDMREESHRLYEEGMGKINGIKSQSTDEIQANKKLEDMVLENERLISADKARSEFLTIMSHELRTPLTSVIGYSIILKEKKHGKLNEKQELYIDNILASSKHLLEIINDVLDLAKMESRKIELFLENVSVPETIKEILNLMKEKAEKRNVILRKRFDPQITFIEADRQRFKQVLFNLVGNAIKFSRDEGGIVNVKTKKEGDMVKISVSDTGIGIRKEDMPRLFQKFAQFDSGISRKYEGTGLGLAITKQIIELHGGKIMVESKPEEGSTFTVFLPIKR